MNTSDFLMQQFVSLRTEIMARQTRLFWTVVIGLLGVPAFAFFASGTATIVPLVLPLFVLVVIIMFLAEQNEMMRAGRFIREQIEPAMKDVPGWEAWLESRGELRLMERHFFACFILVFFFYYFLAIGVALQQLWIAAAADATGQYWYWLWGAVTIYAVGAIWGISTLMQHWKYAISTNTAISSSQRGGDA